MAILKSWALHEDDALKAALQEAEEDLVGANETIGTLSTSIDAMYDHCNKMAMQIGIMWQIICENMDTKKASETLIERLTAQQL